MLHSLYETDRALYHDERQRVQQGFLIIIHAFSGLRPSSTTRTRTRQYRCTGEADEQNKRTEQLVKLRYSDVEIVITADEQGRTRFAVCPTFTKTFTWFDQADVLTCPVAHLIALALFDKAFALPELCNAEKIFSLTPSHGKRLPLPWRSDILDTHILRESREITSGELAGSVALRRLTSLGRSMRYRLPVTWYCFRRLVLNAVDGFGSEEARNHVAGYLESRTYRNSYQNRRVELDIPGIVMKQAPEDDVLIKQFNLMGADADPAANISLPPEAHDQIAALPDVQTLQKEYDAAVESVKRAYGSLRKAPGSAPQVEDWKRKMLTLRAKKEFYRSQMKARRRAEYFAQKDIALIEAQLHENGAKPAILETQAAWIHTIPERAELASLGTLGVAAVQAMTKLCGRVELRRGPVDAPNTAAADCIKTNDAEGSPADDHFPRWRYELNSGGPLENFPATPSALGPCKRSTSSNSPQARYHALTPGVMQKASR